MSPYWLKPAPPDPRFAEGFGCPVFWSQDVSFSGATDLELLDCGTDARTNEQRQGGVARPAGSASWGIRGKLGGVTSVRSVGPKGFRPN